MMAFLPHHEALALGPPGGGGSCGAPAISSMSPTSGTVGTLITITGMGLTGCTDVTVGGVNGDSVTAVSDTSVTLQVPVGVSGTVTVVITGSLGTSTQAASANPTFFINPQFTYTTPPTVTSISPSSGTTSGGTSVVISGTDLTGATGVNFGGSAAASFTVNSATQITAVSPSGSAGAVNITVVTAGGTSSTGASSQFTYVASGPTATANTTAQSLIVGTRMTSFTPLTGSGGTGSLNYYVSVGTLPAGLALNQSTGAVTGTPTATYSTANVVFAVKDANLEVAATTSTVSFTVTASGPTATANTTAQSLTVGTAMTSFTPLTGSGGTGSLTYYVSSGTLPTGLSLNASTGAVTGTPTATYSAASVVFAVKDANNTVAAATSTVSFTVTSTGSNSKPDPTTNATVKSTVFTTLSSVDRVRQSSLSMVQFRLERLHGQVEPFENGIQLVTSPDRPPALAYVDPLDDREAEFRKKFYQVAKSTSTEKVNTKSRLQSLVPQNYSFWTSGMIILGKDNDSRSTFSSVTLGVDYALNSGLRTGFATSLSRDETKLDDDGSKTNSYAVAGMVYGSWNVRDKLYLDGLLGYGDSRFDISRYDANALAVLTGIRPANIIFGSISSSWDQQNGVWFYAPYVRYDFSKATLNSYTEQGDSNWNLSFANAYAASQSISFGLRSRYDMNMSWGIFSPTGRIELHRDLIGSTTQTIAYEATPNSTSDLERSGYSRGSISGSFGFTASGRHGLSGTLEYIMGAGDNGLTYNGGRAQLQIRF